jgi:hypothetical protein
MKVITAGHEYELDSFEGEAPQTIRFINKKPEVFVPYPGVAACEPTGRLITVHDGTTNEEVIGMLIDRMGFLQKLHSCRENAIVITKLEEALMWLNKRTENRKNRNVEGTDND